MSDQGNKPYICDIMDDSVAMDHLREELAAQAHAAWSGWVEYMFGRCLLQPDGSLIIPTEYVQLWNRQQRMKYIELSDKEKDSDRAEADKILSIVLKRKEEL